MRGVFIIGKSGSSPRTWGTRAADQGWEAQPRFIPTHVGNTGPTRRSALGTAVHPHARGEHTNGGVKIYKNAGSSPRTWGTRDRQRSQEREPRFIPTHVGNTAALRSTPGPQPVHPHARGEHGLPQPTRSRRAGSSPRTWGTPHNHSLPTDHRRFIPTHVGNTSTRSAITTSTTVHPHARGEHRDSTLRDMYSSGSSPRTWGTLIQPRRKHRHKRFIPTHVGNTDRCGATHRPHPVHPHARGEHTERLDRLIVGRGSSPRTWGTRAGAGISPAGPRFIPTHVGNTHPVSDCSTKRIYSP